MTSNPATESTARLDSLVRAYAAYEERQTRRDYSLERIGKVQTLLDSWQGEPLVRHPKMEAVWDGPFALPGSPDPRLPYVLLMFVASLDGKVTLDDPAQIGGGPTDWWLFTQGVRYAIDAVAGGRATMCGAPHRLCSLFDPDLVRDRISQLGKPRHPLQVIISGSGQLDPDREFSLAVPDIAAVVITSDVGKTRLEPLCGGRAGKRILAVGPSERTLDFRRALEVLRAECGVERLLLIGGTTVATAFLEAGLVHELFLTQAPRLLGGRDRQTFFEGKGFLPEQAADAVLMSLKIGTLESQYVLFQRWRLPWVPS